MKELFYSALGLTLMVSGFIFIASVSGSLSPRARSQDGSAQAPQNLDPSALPQMPTEMDPSMAAPPTGETFPEDPAYQNPGSELPPPSAQAPTSMAPESYPVAPTNSPSPTEASASTGTGEAAPLRLDPFIPFFSPQKSTVTESTGATPLNENLVDASGIPLVEQNDKFYDPEDPAKSFYLREYKLVGIIWDVARPKAFFRPPNGKLLTLFRKSILGREGSVIVAVRESEVVMLQPGPEGDYEKGTVKILSMRK